MAHTQPLVYIILLTWNGKEDTLDCLRSLGDLEYSNARILVVDNASADGTTDAIRREFPGIELIVNEANLRFSGGNNAGIRHAMACGADYILLLNNDTTVDASFLTHLVAASEGTPGAGMAGPKIYYYRDPQRFWYAGGVIEWHKGWVSHRGVRELDTGQYDVPGETDYITGCCVLVKREVIGRIGMLDDAYYIYGEDADWSVRATRAGYKLLYVPAARVWHKVSVSTGGHFSWFKNWNKLKSQMRLLARYARPHHWLTIPFWFVAKAVEGFLKAKSAQ